ncbi:MAG: PEP-CTERM sorting domain-containing protein [Verrucomicrobiales bacterium]
MLADSSVPEPSSVALLGVVGLMLWSRSESTGCLAGLGCV